MTSIKGPFDDHPRDDIKRMQTAVPKQIAEDLTVRMFPSHGFQDRVLGTMVAWFYRECLRVGIPPEPHPDNEKRAAEILQQLQPTNTTTPCQTPIH